MENTLYRMYDQSKRLLYIGITLDIPRRFRSHRGIQPWWSYVADIRLERFETREELEAAERAAIAAERPVFNVMYAVREGTAKSKRVPMPIQRFRMKAEKWARLGKAATAEGKTRSAVVVELTDWYLRDRPTSQLTRPERVELTPEEAAAAERRGAESESPATAVEQQERAQ